MSCWVSFTSISAFRAGLVRVPVPVEPDSADTLRHERRQVSYPHQVVGRCREGEHPAHPGQTSMSSLTHQPHCLDPAENLFHPFALPLAAGVTSMSGGATVNRTGAVGHVLRHMRRGIEFAQLPNKIASVISLVGTHGHSLPGDLLDHL